MPGGRFDLIVAVESLKHSPDIDVTLARLREALRPGGRIVIVDDFFRGDDDDRTARDLVANWELVGLHRAETYTSALGEDRCTCDDLTGHVPLRSASAST